MMTTANKVVSVQRSVWDIENNFIDESSSSSTTHLQAQEERKISPVRRFSQEITSELTAKRAVDSSEQGCLGCSSWPKAFAFIIALGLVCAAAILVPIVLTNTLGMATKASTTTVTTTISSTSDTTTTSKTTTTSTTSTTTPSCGSGCVLISTSIASRLAFYSFDSNTNDMTGVYSAGGIPSPTYTTGYVGQAIVFDASLGKRLSAPAMSLNSRSFTIEFWFWFSNAASNNYAFFGQMSVQNTAKQCLFLAATGGKLVIGFFNDDTVSSTVLNDNTWYHAAFVYDNDKRQQFIYVNGLLNNQSVVGVGPYFGTSGAITIGGADIYGALGTPYLTGVMDHLTVTTRAKPACEILNDATLAAYFPFDGSFTDAGPNFLTATSSGASMTSGIVNQAAYLSGSNSYIQISGLTGLGRVNYSFSIAFWMYPITPGVLVHVHAAPGGIGWCVPFISVTPTGNIVVQVYSAPDAYSIKGPVIPLNAWTHIVQTYSPTNGQCLYVNGVLDTQWTNATKYTASGSQNFVTIGNLLNGTACYNPGILQNPFQGMIDELRIYSRELSSIDVCLLAWP